MAINIKKTNQKDLDSLQQDLDELEWYIEDLSTFLPLAVCTLNHLGIVINVNKSFEKLTGYSALAIVREPIAKIFFEKESISIVQEKAKQEKVYQTELTVIAKSGKSIPVTVSVSARENKEGIFIGYFMALTDISELKELQLGLEEKVVEKTKELQDRLKDLEKFAQLTVGRELKMIELKNKIKELESKEA